MNIRGAPVRAPLGNDHDYQIAKDAMKEEDLRDEFGPDRNRIVKVNKVGELETDGECHLSKLQHIDKRI